MIRLGQEFMDLAHRDTILQGIAEARRIARELDARAAALPSWALTEQSPMKQDAAKYREAIRNRGIYAAQVAPVEQRLAGPGPAWPALSPAEEASIKNWISSVDSQAALLDRYYPTPESQDIMKAILLLAAAGILFAPVILTLGLKGPPRDPFLPSRIPERPAYRGSMFSRPGLPIPSGVQSQFTQRTLPGGTIQTGPSSFRSSALSRFSRTVPPGTPPPTYARATP